MTTAPRRQRAMERPGADEAPTNVEVAVVAVDEHRTRTLAEHHAGAGARVRAQRTLAVIAYWGPLVLWAAYEIRWRWQRAKARIYLP